METIKHEVAELLVIQEQLKSEQLEKINFDTLILHLEKIQSFYKIYQKTNDEHQILQHNIIKKITTMENAIEIVSKKRPEHHTNASTAEKLSQMNSIEIIEKFDKTETKFHSAFPSTFRIENNYKKQTEKYNSYK